MADLSITANSVVQGAGATVIKTGVWGETVTAGQGVYQKSSDSKWYKAQCDGTAEESGYGVSVGVALAGGALNQPAFVQTGGTITIGATVAVGTVYVVSETAGGICPWADLNSDDRLTVLAYASAAGVLTLAVSATGVSVLRAPTVASVTASSGTTAGGTSVTIAGTQFRTSGTTSVTFGGSAATAVSVSSSTSLTCTTPAHSAGAVDVVVTNPDGQSGTLAGGFTYS